MILDYPGEFNVIRRVLYVKEGDRRGREGDVRTKQHQSDMIDVRKARQPSLALKMEKGATSQGTQAASRSWKRQGNGFPPRA